MLTPCISNGFGVQLRAKRVRCNAWLDNHITTVAVYHVEERQQPATYHGK